jgi:hypothetical protein
MKKVNSKIIIKEKSKKTDQKASDESDTSSKGQDTSLLNAFKKKAYFQN